MQIIVVDTIRSVSAIDNGNGVGFDGTLQHGGEVRVVLPYTLIPAAVQALLAGDDLARDERKMAGIAAHDEVGWALPVSGVHVGMTGDDAHVSLGLALRLGGVFGVRLDRAEANRLGELLQKWAASP